MKYIIIGNGIAGVYGAETIRRYDPEGSITMIAYEVFPPYCRPMISMVLEGAVPFEKLPIRSPDFYEKLNIKPVLGQIVTGIDVEKRSLLVADKNGSRTSICFDRLLIATGANPRPVKAEGTELENIFYMRTENHVKGMINALPYVKKALVLGGGLVGFKAAYGLMRRGINVTMLIKSDYPLSMQVDETAGKMILDELILHGLNVKVGIGVTAFQGNKTVKSALLSDGTTIDCDMAVIGKGVIPAISFIPRDKIKIDLGIIVNAHMETSVPGIFAAGDAAEYIDIARQTRWVNAIWPEAAAQGRIAGMNMAGRPAAYKGSLSRNVIHIFNMEIMTGGIVNPSPDYSSYEIVKEMDSRRGTYRKLVFKEDRLAGMVMVNNIEQGGILISLIQSRTPIRISRKKLIKPSFNYSQLLM